MPGWIDSRDAGAIQGKRSIPNSKPLDGAEAAAGPRRRRSRKKTRRSKAPPRAPKAHDQAASREWAAIPRKQTGQPRSKADRRLVGREDLDG